LAFRKGALTGNAAQVLWDTDRSTMNSLKKLVAVLKSRYGGELQVEKYHAEFVVAWFPCLRPDVQFTVQLFLFTFWRDVAPVQLLVCTRRCLRFAARCLRRLLCVCQLSKIPARAAELILAVRKNRCRRAWTLPGCTDVEAESMTAR